MSAESGSVRCVNLKRKSGRGGIRTSRAKGDRREDRVLDLLDERGRHAVVLRGSGCRGVQQQRRDRYVAGDVIAFPRLEDVGVQFAVGGPASALAASFPSCAKARSLASRFRWSSFTEPSRGVGCSRTSTAVGRCARVAMTCSRRFARDRAACLSR